MMYALGQSASKLFDAQQPLPGEKIENFTQGFTQWVNEPYIAALCVLVGVSLIVWVVLHRHRVNRRSGMLAARAYSRALGVSAGEFRQLKRLARAAGFSTPIPLLLSEGCLQHALATPDCRVEHRIIDSLRSRVFDV